LACPECGADERTGWRETSIYDGMDLPESAWESDEADAAEKPMRDSRRVNGLAWYWWCVGVLLLVFLGLSALSLLR
jgi:hypothetical protein